MRKELDLVSGIGTFCGLLIEANSSSFRRELVLYQRFVLN